MTLCAKRAREPVRAAELPTQRGARPGAQLRSVYGAPLARFIHHLTPPPLVLLPLWSRYPLPFGTATPSPSYCDPPPSQPACLSYTFGYLPRGCVESACADAPCSLLPHCLHTPLQPVKPNLLTASNRQHSTAGMLFDMVKFTPASSNQTSTKQTNNFPRIRCRARHDGAERSRHHRRHRY